MAERLQEGLKLLRRFVGTPYEAAALAYLAAQVEIAKRERGPPQLRWTAPDELHHYGRYRRSTPPPGADVADLAPASEDVVDVSHRDA
jgi:hypothetical protein